MTRTFYEERLCSACGKKSYIYRIEYLAPDGYDHDCGCAYCDEFFYNKQKIYN